ncbi:ABC transporter substrate-binding protein [Nocardia sp. CDC159]|uniref:ABC transporter substrate-binding protein n=1 Tax=Nocardia pulmonis TaxID=2951408 RepID=A0A9X2ECS9_9NOCA|nr:MULTISPECIES: ABC transporter substrate-binding protein [Nocardia]MCM6778469.1 ABC transporter substrate-binding protein [Nocardia pulmonis]MCM6791358.1 ABC transporter substrate-binding protein [Nocardia sp. CDC159]
MRTHPRRALGIVALIVGAALIFTGCAGRSLTSGTTKVTVAVVPSTLFAPLYVARAKGYFDAEGITVHLQKVKAGQDAVGPAASGKVDVVAAGFSAGMFSAIASGLDLKIVGSMGLAPGDAKASPSALEVARKLDGVVTTPADLRGRKVAIAGGPGAAGGFQVATVLQPAGLSLADVQVVNLGIPDMQAALANGSVDAALVAAPFTTRMEKEGVARPLAVPPEGSSATGVIYSGVFARGPAAQRFFDALVRASSDLQDGRAKSEEVLTILAEATGQDIAVLRDTPSYIWLPDLAPLPDQLDRQQQVYRATGLIQDASALNTESFVDFTFARAAVRR